MVFYGLPNYSVYFHHTLYFLGLNFVHSVGIIRKNLFEMRLKKMLFDMFESYNECGGDVKVVLKAVPRMKLSNILCQISL